MTGPFGREQVHGPKLFRQAHLIGCSERFSGLRGGVGQRAARAAGETRLLDSLSESEMLVIAEPPRIVRPFRGQAS